MFSCALPSADDDDEDEEVLQLLLPEDEEEELERKEEEEEEEGDSYNNEPSPARPLQRSPRPISTSNSGSSGFSDGEHSLVMTVAHDTDMDDCPLCVCPMTMADVQFPLCCPGMHCDFNMCANCIAAMQKSEADGYEEASDGSRQVKFHIACPSCRCRYVVPEEQQQRYEEEKKESNGSPRLVTPRTQAVANIQKQNGRNHQPIVGYVLLLREAFDRSPLLKLADSELSSSDLNKKHSFIRETTLDDLKEAALNYENYLKKIHKEDKICTLDWNDFAILPHSAPGGSSALELRNARLTAKPWRDPTLFMGLEELMSLEEQEFVTQLMCSNDVNQVAQATHIMYGILNSMDTQRSAAMVVKELSGFETASPSLPSGPRRVKPPPPLNPKVAQRIKGRFPLPSHMPCCFVIPVYNPHDTRNLPLRFENNLQNLSSPLQLAQVRGIAGRCGLRRGDIITHIHAEPMEDSYEHYVDTVSRMYEDDPTQELMLVVNASEATAKALRERAQQMQQAKITF